MPQWGGEILEDILKYEYLIFMNFAESRMPQWGDFKDILKYKCKKL